MRALERMPEVLGARSVPNDCDVVRGMLNMATGLNASKTITMALHLYQKPSIDSACEHLDLLAAFPVKFALCALGTGKPGKPMQTQVSPLKQNRRREKDLYL
jgi:hypothetical protein